MYKTLSELSTRDLRQLTTEFNRIPSKNASKHQLIAALLFSNQTGGSKFSELPTHVILDEFIKKLDPRDLSKLVESDPDLWRQIQKVPILKSAYDEKTSGLRLQYWLADLGRTYSLEELKNLKELDLRGLELTEIPPEIGNLQSLEELILRSNLLTKLPAEIGNLKSLQKLDLYFNQLRRIPPEIGNLQSLQELDLWHNELKTIPPEISSLRSLRDLNLSDNKLTKIPRRIGNLQSLRELDLSSNKLKRLPREISNLKALVVLHVQNNKFTKIPPAIKKLSQLEFIDVGDFDLGQVSSRDLRNIWPNATFAGDIEDSSEESD